MSVGDEGLKLCISDSETGIALQVIDFGDIVLRSLPDGTCDSIEWDGKNWRHVQRVWRTDLSNAYYHNTTAKFAMANLNPTYGGLHNNPNYVMSNRFVIGSFEDMSNNIGISYINAVNSTYAFNFENEPGTNEHVREWLADNPTELIYKLSTPIETILEGIPALQTFDNETWFGTPSALVKPYMMCECKVKKALKYQGEIIGQYYFGGNKSNETDRQIIDLSGNGNDLIPYNFAWTRESGWNQGGICSDGIDDYLKVLLKEPIYTNDGFTIQLSIKILKNASYDNIAGFVTGIKGGSTVPRDPNRSIGSITNINNNNNNYRAIANSNVQIANNNYKDGTIYAKFKSDNRIITNGLSSVINPDIADESDNDFRVGYSGGDYFEILLLKGYVNEDIIENNKKLLLQRNGVDGDINIG